VAGEQEPIRAGAHRQNRRLPRLTQSPTIPRRSNGPPAQEQSRLTLCKCQEMYFASTVDINGVWCTNEESAASPQLGARPGWGPRFHRLRTQQQPRTRCSEPRAVPPSATRPHLLRGTSNRATLLILYKFFPPIKISTLVATVLAPLLKPPNAARSAAGLSAAGEGRLLLKA